MPENQALHRQQFFADIIVTATEGGTNYWAYSRNYAWSDMDPSLTCVQLCDMEEHDTGHEEWHSVTTAVIEKAFKDIRTRAADNLGIKHETAHRYRLAEIHFDAGDLDADDADNIVQIGLFGKIVYG